MAADWSKSAVLVLLALLPMLAGCAQQAPKATTQAAATPNEPPSVPPLADQGLRPPSSPAAGSVSPQNLEKFADEPALKDVFFEPDRADIVREGTIIMRANARWLLSRWLFDNLDYLVLIEGHTDHAGTREEQFAIAELRAKAAASFLRVMSVPESRLQTISYGSDRPVCTQKSDACGAKNRRVHFRMQRK
jgi:peptidoglycan-associated lipoprotein